MSARTDWYEGLNWGEAEKKHVVENEAQLGDKD